MQTLCGSQRARLRTLISVLALLYGAPAQAVTPDEMLKDPALESRAREISQHLRCVVCQNQSIDDSSAPLAHDLRILVRDRLTSGDSDAQALDYIVARYGNFVLLKPPFQLDTLFLWLGPFLFVVLAGLALVRVVRRQAAVPSNETAAELTPEERRRLEALTDEGTAA
jgi:cytochrome c-type biogenesis protein CcmH